MVMYMLYVAYEVQQNSVVMHSLHGFVGKHHGPTWYGMLLCYFCIMDSWSVSSQKEADLDIKW